jgi:hypothetical protein
MNAAAVNFSRRSACGSVSLMRGLFWPIWTTRRPTPARAIGVTQQKEDIYYEPVDDLNYLLS